MSVLYVRIIVHTVHTLTCDNIIKYSALHCTVLVYSRLTEHYVQYCTVKYCTRYIRWCGNIEHIEAVK